MKHVPEIEKITAFKNICPYLTEACQKELARKLGIDGDNLNKRLEGLRNEDELALVLNFLRCCKHLIQFEEGVSQLTKTATPDFLAQLHTGENLLIEVKSSEKEVLKLSAGQINKSMGVATDLGFSLYYAIKQNKAWGSFSADHVLDRTGKIKLFEDLAKSEFNDKFGSLWYLFPEGLEFHYLYQRDGDGLIQSKHGPLVRFSLRFLGKQIMRATGREPNMFAAHILRAAALGGKQDEPLDGLKKGNYTKIVYRLPFNLFITDYNLYLHLIHSTTLGAGARYDRTAYLKSIQGRKDVVTVETIRAVMRQLEHNGLTVHGAS